MKEYGIQRIIRLRQNMVYDNLVVGSSTQNICDLADGELQLDNSEHLGCYTIYDRSHNLMVSRHETIWMQQMQISMHIGAEFGNVRKFQTKDGQEHCIEIESIETIKAGEKRNKSWETYIDTRKYQCNLNELEARKEFIQYGANGQDDRERALRDIRELMQRGEPAPVYLWDPYLDAYDILDTWYYNNHYGRPLIAITAAAGCGKGTKISDWMRQQEETLQKSRNNYGINIGFYCQHGMFGYGFHDRFLMIDGEKPMVWSLGASVNSLGKSHHIVQQISHAKHVIDSFLELKEQLEREECTIWRSRK